MKIIILTLPLHTNYGGILQCYALQSVLQGMGNCVRILSRPRYRRLFYIMKPLAICKRFFRHFVLREDISILKAPHEIVSEKIDLFIDRYINKYIRRVWNNKIAEDFDAVVVGSDQIWRLKYFNDIEYAFLSFLEGSDIKRIAYAASFGVDSLDYNESQLENCARLLKQFDTVSVRENSGIRICKDYFKVDAVQMLDPTLLLTADDYRKLIEKAVTLPCKGNLLVYLLDATEEKRNIVDVLAHDKGLTPFYINDNVSISKSLKPQPKISVEQWLHSFDNADFVLTDSFHGCIFSIIFKKQFIAIANENRGLGRFLSLFDLFSLNNRLIFSYSDYRKKQSVLEEKIDYNKIDEILVKQRIRAYEYIKLSLRL